MSEKVVGGSSWKAVALVACLGVSSMAMDKCSHGQNGDPKPPPVLVSIFLNAYPVNLQVNTSVQLIATGSYSDGSLVAYEPVAWSMPANAYATVSASGDVTASSTAGATTVTATSTTNPLIFRTAAVNVSLGPPPAPTFTSADPLPNAMAAPSTYTYHLMTTGGQSPLTFSLYGGEFPAGIQLDPDGTIHGSCPSATDATFEIKVTDSLLQLGFKTFHLHVDAFHT